MRLLDNLSLRLYIFLSMMFWKIRLWAQDDEDDFVRVPSRGGDSAANPFDLDEAMADYHPIHISVSDIVMVVIVLVACYVFGKIWKGCSYLLLAFVALMYYLIKFS